MISQHLLGRLISLGGIRAAPLEQQPWILMELLCGYSPLPPLPPANQHTPAASAAAAAAGSLIASGQHVPAAAAAAAAAAAGAGGVLHTLKQAQWQTCERQARQAPTGASLAPPTAPDITQLVSNASNRHSQAHQKSACWCHDAGHGMSKGLGCTQQACPHQRVTTSAVLSEQAATRPSAAVRTAQCGHAGSVYTPASKHLGKRAIGSLLSEQQHRRMSTLVSYRANSSIAVGSGSDANAVVRQCGGSPEDTAVDATDRIQHGTAWQGGTGTSASTPRTSTLAGTPGASYHTSTVATAGASARAGKSGHPPTAADMRNSTYAMPGSATIADGQQQFLSQGLVWQHASSRGQLLQHIQKATAICQQAVAAPPVFDDRLWTAKLHGVVRDMVHTWHKGARMASYNSGAEQGYQHAASTRVTRLPASGTTQLLTPSCQSSSTMQLCTPPPPQPSLHPPSSPTPTPTHVQQQAMTAVCTALLAAAQVLTLDSRLHSLQLAAVAKLVRQLSFCAVQALPASIPRTWAAQPASLHWLACILTAQSEVTARVRGSLPDVQTSAAISQWLQYASPHMAVPHAVLLTWYHLNASGNVAPAIINQLVFNLQPYLLSLQQAEQWESNAPILLAGVTRGSIPPFYPHLPDQPHARCSPCSNSATPANTTANPHDTSRAPIAATDSKGAPHGGPSEYGVCNDDVDAAADQQHQAIKQWPVHELPAVHTVQQVQAVQGVQAAQAVRGPTSENEAGQLLQAAEMHSTHAVLSESRPAGGSVLGGMTRALLQLQRHIQDSNPRFPTPGHSHISTQRSPYMDISTCVHLALSLVARHVHALGTHDLIMVALHGVNLPGRHHSLLLPILSEVILKRQGHLDAEGAMRVLATLQTMSTQVLGKHATLQTMSTQVLGNHTQVQVVCTPATEHSSTSQRLFQLQSDVGLAASEPSPLASEQVAHEAALGSVSTVLPGRAVAAELHPWSKSSSEQGNPQEDAPQEGVLTSQPASSPASVALSPPVQSAASVAAGALVTEGAHDGMPGTQITPQVSQQVETSGQTAPTLEVSSLTMDQAYQQLASRSVVLSLLDKVLAGVGAQQASTLLRALRTVRVLHPEALLQVEPRVYNVVQNMLLHPQDSTPAMRPAMVTRVKDLREKSSRWQQQQQQQQTAANSTAFERTGKAVAALQMKASAGHPLCQLSELAAACEALHLLPMYSTGTRAAKEQEDGRDRLWMLAADVFQQQMWHLLHSEQAQQAHTAHAWYLLRDAATCLDSIAQHCTAGVTMECVQQALPMLRHKVIPLLSSPETQLQADRMQVLNKLVQHTQHQRHQQQQYQQQHHQQQQQRLHQQGMHEELSVPMQKIGTAAPQVDSQRAAATAGGSTSPASNHEPDPKLLLAAWQTQRQLGHRDPTSTLLRAALHQRMEQLGLPLNILDTVAGSPWHDLAGNVEPISKLLQVLSLAHHAAYEQQQQQPQQLQDCGAHTATVREPGQESPYEDDEAEWLPTSHFTKWAMKGRPQGAASPFNSHMRQAARIAHAKVTKGESLQVINWLAAQLHAALTLQQLQELLSTQATPGVDSISSAMDNRDVISASDVACSLQESQTVLADGHGVLAYNALDVDSTAQLFSAVSKLLKHESGDSADSAASRHKHAGRPSRQTSSRHAAGTTTSRAQRAVMQVSTNASLPQLVDTLLQVLSRQLQDAYMLGSSIHTPSAATLACAVQAALDLHASQPGVKQQHAQQHQHQQQEQYEDQAAATSSAPPDHPVVSKKAATMRFKQGTSSDEQGPLADSLYGASSSSRVVVGSDSLGTSPVSTSAESLLHAAGVLLSSTPHVQAVLQKVSPGSGHPTMMTAAGALQVVEALRSLHAKGLMLAQAPVVLLHAVQPSELLAAAQPGPAFEPPLNEHNSPSFHSSGWYEEAEEEGEQVTAHVASQHLTSPLLASDGSEDVQQSSWQASGPISAVLLGLLPCLHTVQPLHAESAEQQIAGDALQPLAFLSTAAVSEWSSCLDAELQQCAASGIRDPVLGHQVVAQLVHQLLSLQASLGSQQQHLAGLLDPLLHTVSKACRATQVSLPEVASLLLQLHNLANDQHAALLSDSMWAPLHAHLATNSLPQQLHQLYELPIKQVAVILQQLAAAGLAAPPVLAAVVDAASYRLQTAPTSDLADLALAVHAAAQASQTGAARTSMLHLSGTQPVRDESMAAAADGIGSQAFADSTSSTGSTWSEQYRRYRGGLVTRFVDDLMDTVMQAAAQLGAGQLVSLLPATAAMEKSRRRQLLHRLATHVSEQVDTLTSQQVMGLLGSYADARMSHEPLLHALTRHMRANAHAYQVDDVVQAVMACHACGCTAVPIYWKLIHTLRELGALPRASRSPTAPAPVGLLGRLSQAAGLLTGAGKQTVGTASSKSSEVEPATTAVVAGSNSQQQQQQQHASQDQQQAVAEDQVVLRKAPSEAIPATDMHKGQNQRQGELTLWQLQAIYNVLQHVKHPEAKAIGKEFVRRSAASGPAGAPPVPSPPPQELSG